MTAAIKTADMSRDDWLEERTKGIGGSDVATVLGLNPYKTPLQLWEEKTGKSKGHEAGEAAYWGTQLEDLVAKEFSKRTGMKVQRVNFMLTAGEDGWMRGNLDRAIVNTDIAGRVSVLKSDKAAECGRLLSTDVGLECKTANQFMAEHWGDSQEQEILAGQVVTDHKIPLYYETQIQWYMAVTGLRKFYVAVLIGGNDFRMYEVPRDEDVIQALVSQCEAFWKNNVLADVPPAPVNGEDIKKLYRKDNGEMTEATNEEAADIGELRTLKERIKELQEQEKAVASRVIMAIGEKAELLIGGAKAVTYKAMNSTRFSSTDFKKEHPDLYKDYAKTTSTRVLRLA
ncbi:MAG: YqaJ viral recombinase family protein [Sutterella wadsworthensis]|nr:YqaJ viral recombinase family protein [Sutterella wadsworthensis]